jgi:hypothetical protein
VYQTCDMFFPCLEGILVSSDWDGNRGRWRRFLL